MPLSIDTPDPAFRLAPSGDSQEDAALCAALLEELRGAAGLPSDEAARRWTAAGEFLIGLDLATGSAARVECLLAVVQHHYLAARPEAALPAAERAAQLARRLADAPLLRKALNVLGVMHMETGNLPASTACYSEALAIAQRLGDPGAEAPVWNNLGLALQNAAQYADAIGCFERAASLAERSPAFSHARRQALANIAGSALHLLAVRVAALTRRGSALRGGFRGSRLQPSVEAAGGQRAAHPFDQRAAMEYRQRRDAADGIAGRQARVRIGVDFGEHKVRMARRRPGEHRREGAAGAAPRGPKVDDDRPFAALDQLGESRLVDRDRCAGQQLAAALAAGGRMVEPFFLDAVGGLAMRAAQEHRFSSGQ
jgi:tetratricopeptide (TPR) repeat protein